MNLEILVLDLSLMVHLALKCAQFLEVLEILFLLFSPFFSLISFLSFFRIISCEFFKIIFEDSSLFFKGLWGCRRMIKSSQHFSPSLSQILTALLEDSSRFFGCFVIFWKLLLAQKHFQGFYRFSFIPFFVIISLLELRSL